MHRENDYSRSDVSGTRWRARLDVHVVGAAVCEVRPRPRAGRRPAQTLPVQRLATRWPRRVHVTNAVFKVALKHRPYITCTFYNILKGTILYLHYFIHPKIYTLYKIIHTLYI